MIKFDSIQERFFGFYKEKQTGTKLTWQFELSFCELYGFFNSTKVNFFLFYILVIV